MCASTVAAASALQANGSRRTSQDDVGEEIAALRTTLDAVEASGAADSHAVASEAHAVASEAHAAVLAPSLCLCLSASLPLFLSAALSASLSVPVSVSPSASLSVSLSACVCVSVSHMSSLGAGSIAQLSFAIGRPKTQREHRR